MTGKKLYLWKPDYKLGKTDLIAMCKENYEAGKQARIKEVVEFLFKNFSETLYSAGLFQVVMTREEWLAKLKSWGIKWQ